MNRRVREGERLGAKHQGDRDRLRIDCDRLVTEQRKRFRDSTRADWRDLYAIQRQERRRFTDAQRNAWSRVRFDIRTYGENYRKAGRGGRKDMLKGAASALVGSKAQKEKLELKQKNERLFFARKLKERADKLTIPIRSKHERDLTELHKKQERERHELQMKQSKESQAEARELKEGRDKELFSKEQRGKLRHELTETKRDVTTPVTPREKASPSLADRFRKAQEKGVGDKSKDQFRDNANDVGKGAGRERNKKPPK